MEIQDEKKFIEGFNIGYLLYKYEPILFDLIFDNIDLTSLFIRGLSFGKLQVGIENASLEIFNLRNSIRKDKESLELDY